jgi:DNA repair exonuclease SbcCD ATPase subunit
MQIVELRAENVKRLSAVTIRPTGPVVEITGKNEAGKSSVLDSIWMALGGAEVMDAQPIRKGADKAMIRLDLGDMVVTRKIKRKEGTPPFTTSIVVETPDGQRPKSPQTMLNEMLGRFTLDPLAFSRMKPGEQFDAMKAVVPDFDFDASIKAEAEAYEKRTGVNRRAKETRAAAEVLSGDKVEPVDEEAILKDMARAGDYNAGIQERRARRDAAQAKIDAGVARIDAAQEEIDSLQERITALCNEIATHTAEVDDLRKKLANAPALPAPLDTAHLAAQLAEAKRVNAAAAGYAQRQALLKQAQDFEGQSAALTKAIEDEQEKRDKAIAAAKLPVEGLTLGDGEVLVDGLPFEQAAASRKIRVSVALAMALNPKIRVIRIMDGSLLDDDAMKMVHDMAAANDFQVWCETVQSDSPGAIIIEDGHVKGVGP